MVTRAKQWQSAHIDVAHQMWVVHTSRWVFSTLVVNAEIIVWMIQAMQLMPESAGQVCGAHGAMCPCALGDIINANITMEVMGGKYLIHDGSMYEGTK